MSGRTEARGDRFAARADTRSSGRTHGRTMTGSDRFASHDRFSSGDRFASRDRFHGRRGVGYASSYDTTYGYSGYGTYDPGYAYTGADVSYDPADGSYGYSAGPGYADYGYASYGYAAPGWGYATTPGVEVGVGYAASPTCGCGSHWGWGW